MPDTGSPWNIPYPLSTDPPDDPSQSKSRAEKIAADFSSVDAAYKNADAALATRLSAVESKNTSQDSSISAISTRTVDTGNVTLPISWASGWKAGTGAAPVARKLGAFCYIRVGAIRTGGNISSGGTGNIADIVVGTITNAAFQPAYNYNYITMCDPGYGAGLIKVNANGGIYLVALYPNNTVATGHEIQFSMVYTV